MSVTTQVVTPRRVNRFTRAVRHGQEAGVRPHAEAETDMVLDPTP